LRDRGAHYAGTRDQPPLIDKRSVNRNHSLDMLDLLT
jgi:hypothetical protein